MNIVVCGKMVPDLVEELEINADGTDLDRSYVRPVLNEFDDQAIEQALLLKNAAGGAVTVIAPEGDGVDEVLYAALARGADRAVKVTGLPEGTSSRVLARGLAEALSGLAADLILTGVQAADDRDGQVGALLAGFLDLPHVGVVTGIQVDTAAGTAVVHKEYAGGMLAEFEVALPAVVGIQAAAQPPRYVPISKIRQAMKEKRLEEITVDAADAAGNGAAPVRRMFKPTADRRAEILSGAPEAVAERIEGILRERGLLR